MRGSVLLVLASLGLAAVGSMLLWVLRKVTWRRPVPFLRQLEAVSGVPGRSVGPASGVSSLGPLHPDPPSSSPSASRSASLGPLHPDPPSRSPSASRSASLGPLHPDPPSRTAADAAADAPAASER